MKTGSARFPAAGLVRFLVAFGAAWCQPASSWAVEGAGQATAPAVSAPVATQAGQLIDFDIPSQPLATALARFYDTSGRSTLFPGALLAGRYSSSVKGRFTAEDALQRLVAGSGLVMETIHSNGVSALLLKLQAPPLFAPDDPSRLDGYENLVQARIWRALCANPATAARHYRTLLQFDIDATGRIHHARLLGSTGDTHRDTVLLNTLEHTRLDQPPPPDMHQPVTMLILPQQAGGPACVKERRQ